jgi:citrate lyase subunit beta/citryl-CoA lyase
MNGPTGASFRSLLFVPGDQEGRFDKAFASGADAVIIDLEDAVAAGRKALAREAVARALDRGCGISVFVRVNAFLGTDCYEDLLAVVRPGLAGLVLPKAEAGDALRTLDWVVGQLERQRGLQSGSIELLPLIETARGAEAMPEVALATPRVRRLSFGVADYSLDLGLERSPDEAGIAYLRAQMVQCSRAAGLEPPVDSVVVEVRDEARFRESASRARALGMRGKLCLHPAQVPLANEVFAPAPEDIERARTIVAAFDAASRTGVAALTVGGEFVDAPVAERARRLLAWAAGRESVN